MLTHVKPKDLLRFAAVCKNWHEILRSNAFWNRFRNHVCRQLPMLESLFAQTPAVWRVFAHQLWPAARNVDEAAMGLTNMRLEIFLATLQSYICSAWPNFLKSDVLCFATTIPIVKNAMGAINLKEDKMAQVTCRQDNKVPDLRLQKILGLKRQKLCKSKVTYCSIAAFTPGAARGTRHFSNIEAKHFFYAYFKIVFCTDMFGHLEQ